MSTCQPEFIPGLELSKRLFAEVVRPILADAFSRLVYSAALIGFGSEVLGFDTARSTDHGWGSRMQLFLADEDEQLIPEIVDALRHRLPPIFLGYSTHFGPPDAEGTRLLEANREGPVDHMIEVVTLRAYFERALGIDPRREPLLIDWLTTPQQTLLEMTAGRVFHDGLGELHAIRARLAYYPRDVWLYLMAAQWQRISQQEAFVGRAGEVGDEIGSALIAGVLVHDLMQLGFLLERRYAPYSKWFGTAFNRLMCAAEVEPFLRDALRAATWQEREGALGLACEAMARCHNALSVTPPLDTTLRGFHNRPFQVLDSGRFMAAIAEVIESPEVLALIERAGWIGGIDHLSDNVDLKTHPERTTKLHTLFA